MIKLAIDLRLSLYQTYLLSTVVCSDASTSSLLSWAVWESILSLRKYTFSEKINVLWKSILLIAKIFFCPFNNVCWENDHTRLYVSTNICAILPFYLSIFLLNSFVLHLFRQIFVFCIQVMRLLLLRCVWGAVWDNGTSTLRAYPRPYFLISNLFA